MSSSSPKLINYNVTTLSSASRTDENVFNSNIFSFRFDNLLLLSAPPLTTVKEKFLGLFSVVFGSQPSRCVTKRNVLSDKDGMRLDASIHRGALRNLLWMCLGDFNSGDSEFVHKLC